MQWGNPQQKAMKVRFFLERHAFLKEPSPVVPYLPDQLDVDISNRCNLRCGTCFHSFRQFRPWPDMTFDTFRTILDQAEGKSSTITFGNHGEPFLHKHALQMMKEVKERGFFLNVINNGTLLNEERAQALLEIGPDRVAFSVDSVDPEIYPKLRPGADFATTLRNILSFLKLNFENGLKVFVNVSTVNSRLAAESEPDIRDYFSRLPVHVVYTSDILNFHDMLEIREETKFRQRYADITEPSQFPICVNGFDRLLIRPNGNASLCAIDWDNVHILGNVNETHYADLWNNERAQEFRRALITRDYSLIERNGVLCSKCDGKWVQDIRQVCLGTVELFANDLRNSKPEIDAGIATDEHYEALLRELEAIEVE